MSILIDPNLNTPGTNKKIDDIQQELGAQGSDKQAASQSLKEAITTTGMNGVEEELAGIGATNQEMATKTTKNQTGHDFEGLDLKEITMSLKDEISNFKEHDTQDKASPPSAMDPNKQTDHHHLP